MSFNLKTSFISVEYKNDIKFCKKGPHLGHSGVPEEGFIIPTRLMEELNHADSFVT